VQRHFAAELSQLKPMVDGALLTINDAGIEVLNAGRLLICRVGMAFDAYLNNFSAIRYSKVV